MTSLRFTIPGEPVPKQRARQAQLPNGRVHSYTPAKTARYEERVAWSCKAAARGSQFDPGAPLCVEAWFYVPIPKSLSRRQQEALRGEWCTKKPDTDNLLKSILDGCNGIAYKDDNQIALTVARKIYSDCPRAEVDITILGSRKTALQDRRDDE